MNDERSRTWRAAMTDALYGRDGFYLEPGAAGRNFRTSAHIRTLWAEAVMVLASRVDDSLGSPAGFTVVDVGAGGGELLGALADMAPPRWNLLGVDLAGRPDGLPARVCWTDAVPAGVVGLLLANELLDVVPVDVAQLADDGHPRLVSVSHDGEESLGEIAGGRDAQWLSRWWPLDAVGDRAEIGWPRDDLWQSLTACLDRGVAVAVDYAAIPARDVAGTLAGYREGRQVAPVPDGSCDLTAHVVFESLTVDGNVLIRQREALQSLGVSADRPSYDGDPTTYLAALSATGDAAELLDPNGLGGFTWLVHSRGVSAPLSG